MRKSIVFFTTVLLSSLACAQQPDTSYHLLWYKGKKIGTNVLLTPAKDTVRYDAVKSKLKVTHTSGNGKELDKLLKEMNNTPKRINDMAQRMQSGLPKPVVPAYVSVMQESYQYVQREMTPCLSNTMELPTATFAKTSINKSKGPSFNYEETGEPTFDEALQEVLNYYEQHKNDKITFVPAPPRREFTYCILGGKTVEAQYDREFDVFLNELSGKDHDIWILLLKLYRYSQLLMTEEERQVLEPKLDPVREWIFQRMYDRAKLLTEKYGYDPYRCWAVLKVALMVGRHLAIVGWYEENNRVPLEWDVLERAARVWHNLFEKAMEEYDYTIALNLHGILMTERLSQIHQSGHKMPLDRLLQFNRFKLNMHVSAKIDAKGGYQLAELEGDNWYSAVPDSTGRLRWILIGPLVNKVSMNLKAAEFRGKIDFPYVGSRKWEGQMPHLQVDFCDRQEDTLNIYMFSVHDNKETWVFPDPQGPTDLVIVEGVLTATFLDIERIEKMKREIKDDPATIEKTKKEMLAKVEEMKKAGLLSSVSNDGSMGLAQMSKMNELQRSVNDILNKSRKFDPLKFVFQANPHNRTSVVLQEKINGKELFPQNPYTQYAWFHIKLEQDPNCPYDLSL